MLVKGQIWRSNLFRDLKFKNSLLAILIVAFVTIFQSGCGEDSRDAFVATGANQSVASGNLVFNFQKPAAQEFNLVPADTITLRIDLFNSATQNVNTLVLSDVFPFAERRVIYNVPSTVVSARVTAINADGLPLAFLSGPVEVVINSDNEVVFDSLESATFDALDVTPNVVNLSVSRFSDKKTDQAQLSLAGTISGVNYILPINEDAVTFEFANPALFNISSTGLISSTFNIFTPGGNTTLTATYNYLGVNQVDTITANLYIYGVVAASTEVVQGVDDQGAYGVEFYRPTTVQEDISTRVTYSIESPVTGITVAEDGAISVSSSVPVGTQFVVVATFVDNGTGGSGLTFTDKVKFTVVEQPD